MKKMLIAYIFRTTKWKCAVFAGIFCCFYFFGITLRTAEGGQGQEKTEKRYLFHFDNSEFVEAAKVGVKVVNEGGKIVPQGICKKALIFGSGSSLKIISKDLVSTDEGSLALWIQLNEDHVASVARPLVSINWGEQSKGAYSVLSLGWWNNSKRLYFMINNRSRHVSGGLEILPFSRSRWTHVACTWMKGTSGFVRLYVDGTLVEESSYGSQYDDFSADCVMIGSDRIIRNNLGRKMSREAYCKVDEMIISNVALGTEELMDIAVGFRSEIPKVPIKETVTKPPVLYALEMRALFDEGKGWMTENGANNVISKAINAGFNVYIPCVWHGSGTRFPSTLALPEYGLQQLLENDPLKRLIDLAHQNGLEVHPWVTVSLRQRRFYENFYDSNTPEKAFDIHRPAFRAWMTDIIADLTSRYDVDGINLDFIRTMGVCKCRYCKKRYKADYGRDLTKDASLFHVEKERSPQLLDFQDKAVTAMVRDIRSKIKNIKPHVLLSVDAYGRPNYRNPEGRNVIDWANEGIIDFFFHMDYGRSPDFHHMEAVRQVLTIPKRLVPLISNYEISAQGPNPNRHPCYLSNLASMIRWKWPGTGMGLYHSGRLDDAQINALSGKAFRIRAVTPWRSNKKKRQ